MKNVRSDLIFVYSYSSNLESELSSRLCCDFADLWNFFTDLVLDMYYR